MIDADRDNRIAYITANKRKLENDRQAFAVKHSFWLKRAQDFKHCVVIRWKHRKKKNDKDFIDYERIDQWVDITHNLCDKYELWDERHPFLDTDLMLSKIGIYCFYSWDCKTWAIPNDNKEIQEYVLSQLPAWVKVTTKL